MVRIPDKMVREVCRPGTTGCCRYLALGDNGFECQRHGPLREAIDQRADSGGGRATRINCEGIVDMDVVK